MKKLDIKHAADEDRQFIVNIWHQGWHDAHHDLVPKNVIAFREVEHFHVWLDECILSTFVAWSGDTLVGFHSLDQNELTKLYVRRDARGLGMARKLLIHAENLLSNQGVLVAELFCTAGNVRAQRFYERHNWKLSKTFMDELWQPERTEYECKAMTLHYKKDLSGIIAD